MKKIFSNAGNQKLASVIGLFSVLTAMSFTACGQAGAQSAQAAGTEAQGLPWGDAAMEQQPDHITVAVKYVSYLDSSGKPAIGPEEVQAILPEMNKLFNTCNMSLRIEDYAAVQPADVGLEERPNSMSDLDPIRTKFMDASRLLVVNTTSWDQSGGLGSDGANAWTQMPGNDTDGAVLEADVAKTANLVAHELGHYLNLDHESDKLNMMNPVIYTDSTAISPSQCETMRTAAKQAWPNTVRG